jgi:hypothetical protein
MPQYYPVVVQAGKSLMGDSLGFHAYSLRIDNLTNQWLLEESSLAWIPPYSLGVCLRLYGTSVGLIVNQAPIGQPQLGPISGEQTVGVYSDQYRTEVAGTPVRQFTLVQAVSDLTQGPAPASPPVGITRLWAAADGTLHYSLSSGAQVALVDSTNFASYAATQPLGGDLAGVVSNGTVRLPYGHSITTVLSDGSTKGQLYINAAQPSSALAFQSPGTGGVTLLNNAGTAWIWQVTDAGNSSQQGSATIQGAATINGAVTLNNSLTMPNGTTTSAPQWTINNGGYTYLRDQLLQLYAGRSAVQDNGSGLINLLGAGAAVRNASDTANNPITVSTVNLNPATIAYTPLCWQGAGMGLLNPSGQYCTYGKMVICWGNFGFSSVAGAAAGQPILIGGFPIAADAGTPYGSSYMPLGWFTYLRSGVAFYIGHCQWSSVAGLQMILWTSSGPLGDPTLGRGLSYAIGINDQITWFVMYKAA